MSSRVEPLHAVATSENKHRLVRDILWAVASPPLLLPTGDCRFQNPQWFQAQADDLAPALAALNNNFNTTEELYRQWSSLRLGGYFEQLIVWWLQHSSCYELLAHNLQVQGEERTLGAFDLIVRDRRDDVVEHWELACKFYLQDGDSQKIESWYGPARQDKLISKYQHLLNHQIALSDSEHGRQTLEKKGWRVERHKIMVKGRLFGNNAELPDAVNPNCLRGWLRNEQEQQAIQPADNRLRIPLQREHWMSTAMMADIDKNNAHTASRHGCICLAELENGVEINRGFVVPNNWAQQS